MKNLETEYKNQISHEAPDLWDRIEAGIDKIEAEKAATQQTVPQTNIQQFPTQQYAANTNNTVSGDNVKTLRTRKIINTIRGIYFFMNGNSFGIPNQGRLPLFVSVS